MTKAKTQKEITKKHVLSANYQKHYMRSAYGKPAPSTIKCDDGITEQHHTEQCDVNNILATYLKTGIIPPSDPNAQYGDLSDFDYQSMQNQIANATSLFEQLPDNVKHRFGNEPYRFLNFVQDEKNYDELVEMGLANNAPTTSSEDEALPVTDAAPQEQVMSDDTVAT
ncbi:MAG: internal scaffolding protein [Microviridae sp.]|nr:MAG: internal scaffolding protein [Microviridae sp.]